MARTGGKDGGAPPRAARETRPVKSEWRSTIIFLISAIASRVQALGQVWAQFMMVWQR